jgi:hypothetical protein
LDYISSPRRADSIEQRLPRKGQWTNALVSGDKVRAEPREISRMTTSLTAMRSLLLALAATLMTAGPAAAEPIPGTTNEQTMLLIVGVLLIVFCAIGAYLIYAGIKNRRLAKASELWPTAGGKVLGADISKRVYRDKDRRTTTFYTPRVHYTYSVGSTDYEGDVIRFGDVEQGHISLAEAIIAKYPTGSVVAVRYDPDDPKRATLETQSAGGGQIATGIFFIVIPLAIAIGTALIMYFAAGQKASLPPEVLEQLNKPN